MSYEDIVSPSKLANTRRYEVQRTNNFEFVVPAIFGSTDLSMAVETFPLPNIQTEPMELHLGNSSVKVATAKATFEGGDLVLKDFIEADIENIVLQWQAQVYNPRTNQVGYAYQYKKRAIVNEYSPDGSFVRTWVLEGIWPSGVNFGELNYEEGGKKQVTVTLSYDKAYRE